MIHTTGGTQKLSNRPDYPGMKREKERGREGEREREGYCISIKDLILTSQLDILINASAIVKLVVPLSLLS